MSNSTPWMTKRHPAMPRRNKQTERESAGVAIELTDHAIRRASPLPSQGTHRATVTGTRELPQRDGRLIVAISLCTLEGSQFDDVQTVRAKNANPYIQAGLARLRAYVDIAAPESDLTDFYACLEAIEGASVEVDVEHYKTSTGLYKAKVTAVRSASLHEPESAE